MLLRQQVGVLYVLVAGRMQRRRDLFRKIRQCTQMFYSYVSLNTGSASDVDFRLVLDAVYNGCFASRGIASGQNPNLRLVRQEDYVRRRCITVQQAHRYIELRPIDAHTSE